MNTRRALTADEYCTEKLPSRFFMKYKTKINDLPSQHGIKPCLREPTIAENRLIPCFFVQKAAVLEAESGGFLGKKRRY